MFFPRFTQFACFPRPTRIECFCFELWLVNCITCFCCSWLARKEKAEFAHPKNQHKPLVLDVLGNIIIGHEVLSKNDWGYTMSKWGKPTQANKSYKGTKSSAFRQIIFSHHNFRLFYFFYLTEVIEGDILVTEPLRNVLKAGNSRAKRDIVSDMVKRWPDGVVPYKLDSSLSKCLFRIWYLV